MELYDPFEQVTKNYGRGIESPPVRIVTALLPTGRNVGSANDLVHVHNSHGGGGRATNLEHYRGHGTKLGRKMAGPIHKGDDVFKALPKFRSVNSFTRGEKLATKATYGSKGDTQVVLKKPEQARQNRAAVERGLQMATGTYKPPRPRMFADLEHAYGRARPVAKGMIFQNGMSRGRRIA